MCSCQGLNSVPSCRQTLQNSTAPLKRNEILEKSEVIQIPSLTLQFSEQVYFSEAFLEDFNLRGKLNSFEIP